MLSLFKTKPKLSELIPQGFTDIHSHFLPNIDDGAKSIAHTQGLLNAVIELGFKKAITTPHTKKSVWNNTSESITTAFRLVHKELPEISAKLSLNCASEYFIDDHFTELFKSEKLLTLKENYVLVEISYISPPLQLFDILFELQLAGYKPVLAHPERYVFYHNRFDEYERLKKAGCLFQMNLLSSIGYYGKTTAETADKLLERNMIDFTGSDIHHQNHIEAFQAKIVLKHKTKLEKALDNNRFFAD